MNLQSIVFNVAYVLGLEPEELKNAIQSFSNASKAIRFMAFTQGEMPGMEAEMIKGIRLYLISIYWADSELEEDCEEIARSLLEGLQGEILESATSYVGMLRQCKGHPVLSNGNGASNARASNL